MRKLVLSLLLCFGVGFAMMGSPAQANDDNGGAKIGASVQSVNKKAPVHKGVAFTKEELQKMEVEVIKLKKAPTGSLMREDGGTLHRLGAFVIIHKPKPPKPPQPCGPIGGNVVSYINDGPEASANSKPKPGLSTE